MTVTLRGTAARKHWAATGFGKSARTSHISKMVLSIVKFGGPAGIRTLVTALGASDLIPETGSRRNTQTWAIGERQVTLLGGDCDVVDGFCDRKW